MTKIPSVSREYILIPVSVSAFGVSVDVTQHPVEIAIVVRGSEEPEESDWQVAAWQTDDDDVDYARFKIGEPDFPLENGSYDAWVRITTPDERPVRKAGPVTIT